MSASTVRRTLIRSTPELWAEISDAAALGRHLEEFGDIRITRLEEEEAVVWESELAKGTVTLEPSGLGTRVTLTAIPLAPQRPTMPPPAASQAPQRVISSAPPAPAPPPPLDARPRLFTRRNADRPGLLERLRARPRATTPVPEPATPPPAPQPPPAVATQPAAAPATSALDSDRATAVLTNVLNQLGTARHRPFGAT